MRIDIFCTIGPSSLNKKFLKFAKNKIDLLRINMSHVSIKSLKQQIKFIKKNSSIPICIDTEGAQIRTKIKKKKYYKKNKKLIISKYYGSTRFYPYSVFDKLKLKDKLELGFSGLEIEIKKKLLNRLICKVIKPGLLEKDKGVHVKNRRIKMNYLTEKDIQAIKIARENKIKNFALSFTNTAEDVKKFNTLLDNKVKIFKLETKSALKNLKQIIKFGKNFLIDRGDLSKDIGIENVPLAQRLIFKRSKKFRNINIAVATNFLESMITKPYPTRAEVNDIYNSLEMGAKGLVLAGETAMGKHPIECVKLLSKIISVFKSKKKFYV